MAHFVPNIFCALPTDSVALTRRWVTSTVALTLFDLKAFTTALRLDELAPYLLWSLDNERYLPYDDDDGLLADFAAFCTPELFATSPIWRPSLRLVEVAPTLWSPLWEIGP